MTSVDMEQDRADRWKRVCGSLRFQQGPLWKQLENTAHLSMHKKVESHEPSDRIIVLYTFQR